LLHLNSNSQLTFATKEKIKIRILRFVKKCEEVEENTEEIKSKYKSFTKLRFDKGSGLSKCVEIQHSKEMGRGLFASKNIKPGTIYIHYSLY